MVPTTNGVIRIVKKDIFIIIGSILTILVIPHIFYYNPKAYTAEETLNFTVIKSEGVWEVNKTYSINYTIHSIPLITHHEVSLDYDYDYTNSSEREILMLMEIFVNNEFVEAFTYTFIDIQNKGGGTHTSNIDRSHLRKGINTAEIRISLKSVNGVDQESPDKVQLTYYNLSVREVNGLYFE